VGDPPAPGPRPGPPKPGPAPAGQVPGPRPGPGAGSQPVPGQRGQQRPAGRAAGPGAGPGGGGRPGRGRQNGGARTVRAAGPLGRVICSDGSAITPGEEYRLPGYEFRDGTSALIMLHRVAFFDGERRKLDESGQRVLLRWAAEYRLGQDGELIGQVAARRASAVARLRQQGLHVIRLRAVPEWRLAVGLGNKANAHEIGLSLHGTYGWPVIPGSSLKGLAAAQAVASGADPAVVRRVLGTPRRDVPAPAPAEGQSPEPEETGGRGMVCFLDAVPAAEAARVDVDVLTPHVKAYYESTAGGPGMVPVPPAEYHNPVPVNFLTVGGAFAVDLYGTRADDVRQAAAWLAEAGDELGAGGKTAAGYGYLAFTELPVGQDQA
jgi:CRISPR type III-B/RAMP module RAMP protein Cmr6